MATASATLKVSRRRRASSGASSGVTLPCYRCDKPITVSRMMAANAPHVWCQDCQDRKSCGVCGTTKSIKTQNDVTLCTGCIEDGKQFIAACHKVKLA